MTLGEKKKKTQQQVTSRFPYENGTCMSQFEKVDHNEDFMDERQLVHYPPNIATAATFKKIKVRRASCLE